MSVGSSSPDALHSDSDVALSNPTTGQVLGYSASLAKWQNQAATTIMVDVKSFGAKGDGTTDDTTAIQNALDSVAPSTTTGQAGTVFFPSGTYLTGPLTIGHRVSIMGVGYGTTLLLKSGVAALGNLITNGTVAGNPAQMCRISHMRLDGNKFNLPGTNWNCGIVLINSTLGEYGDGRHQVDHVTIQNFRGDGFVQSGRGGSQVTAVATYQCDGFGFNINQDSVYTNCDAGVSGLDGWIIQGGSNSIVGCKSWYSGAKLCSSRSTSTATTRTAPANSWDGGNFSSALTFSFANGYGNGFLWGNISSTAFGANFSSGTYTGLNAQDNGRAGFFVRGGTQVLSAIVADSNNNNGTSDGTSSGTPVGSYAGVEIDAFGTDNSIDGMSWERSANTNHQAAALSIPASATRSFVRLTMRGALNDASAMPPLLAGSVVADSSVSFRAQNNGFKSETFAASYTPSPQTGDVKTMTLTGAITINNPAISANQVTGIFIVPGSKLTFILTQDATGGRVVTWGSAFKLNGFTMNTASSAVNVISFIYDGTNWQSSAQVNGTAGAAGGGTTLNLVSKNANYTAANGDCVVCDASGGAFTVTSPAAVLNASVFIKKNDSSTNAVTFSPASGTVDGNATYILTSQYDAFHFICDGTNWVVF